jgi:IS5 family transposase
MEDRVWRTVCQLIDMIPDAPGRFVYGLRLILRVGLWATLHDRPFCWACAAHNWPAQLRPSHLPDQSTLSRRWRTKEVRGALASLHRLLLNSAGSLGRYAAIDGRPLPVGGASQDRDARAGRSVRGLGRGYKLYAMVTAEGLIACFTVRPMNQAEQTVARSLLTVAPRELKRVVGDLIYDSVPLHRAAARAGRRLYTALRENRVGNRQQPRRLQLLRLNRTSVGRRLLRSRDVVERAFARMSSVGFGYKGLPSWARRRHRVTAWISGKILLYNAYVILRDRCQLAA